MFKIFTQIVSKMYVIFNLLFLKKEEKKVSHSVMSDSLQPHGL